jgi:mycothiol synthase
MLDSRYRLRRLAAGDADAHVAILNRIDPDHPITVEQWRREDEFVHTPPMICHQFAIDETSSDCLVAVGGTVTALDSVGEGNFWVGAGVDPDPRGRGLGRVLARVLEDAATESGALRLWASAPVADGRAVRFLHLQGFREKPTNWMSSLDLNEVATPPPPNEESIRAEGVEITDLASEGPEDPEVIEKVFAVVAATMGDAPRMGAYVPVTREQFSALMISGPDFLPEGLLLARAEGRYVGMSNLRRIAAEPQVLYQMFTATLPEYRGRGIATALKRRGIRFARDHGYRSIRTDNDSLNTAIWSINQRLGFRGQRETVWAEKSLAPP